MSLSVVNGKLHHSPPKKLTLIYLQIYPSQLQNGPFIYPHIPSYAFNLFTFLIYFNESKHFLIFFFIGPILFFRIYI